MKFSLAILASLAISAFAGPVVVTQRNLHDDLQEFVALIPVDKIKEIFYAYLEQDTDFQAAFDYLTSEEFTSLLYEVETMPEVKNFLNHLEELGVPVWKYVNMLNNELGLDPVSRGLATGMNPPGVKGFLQVVREMIPQEKLGALYKHKLETSKEFKELVDHLKSPASQEFADKMMKHPKVQMFMAKAEEHGVDVQEVLDYLSSMLGLKFSEESGYLRLIYDHKYLFRDLKEFYYILSTVDIEFYLTSYEKSDAAFREALNWIKSDEWSRRITNVENVKEFHDILHYFEDDFKLPAYDFVNKFNVKFGIPIIQPVKSRVLEDNRSHHHEDWGGFSGFLDLLYRLLPQQSIHDLYIHKLQSSLFYKNFVHKLNGPHAAELFQKLVNHEHFQALAQEAEKYGINYREIVELIKYAFGVSFYRPA